ncbi:major allergen Pru ar 1-like [Abrus precatorius]|uniref:Major allergen Pru ar 1-like n=1 Tax=Abrus precatorius TaxID=3816 RepID=A0A8B8K920_ABRPR|nr:major allergen Pru ar 1-like [Abrus precatorius]
MDFLTFNQEYTSTIQAERVFKALILDAPNLIPKLMPQAIKKVQLVEGNGGPGSIQEITIAEGDQIKHLKHRIDGIDQEKLTYSYAVIEGDALLEKVDSISHEIKVEPTEKGGCKVTTVSKYHPKPGVEIKEDDFKAAKEQGLALLKVVDAHLIANPQAYA